MALAVLSAAAALGVAAAADPEPAERGVFDVRCGQDDCRMDFTYVRDQRSDDHEVVVVWRTRPAPGLAVNEADTVHRRVRSGVGQPVAGGHRYTVGDVIWHSDLRCDDQVEITVTPDGETPAVVTVSKPVPAPWVEEPFCSRQWTETNG